MVIANSAVMIVVPIAKLVHFRVLLYVSVDLKLLSSTVFFLIDRNCSISTPVFIKLKIQIVEQYTDRLVYCFTVCSHQIDLIESGVVMCKM